MAEFAGERPMKAYRQRQGCYRDRQTDRLENSSWKHFVRFPRHLALLVQPSFALHLRVLIPQILGDVDQGDLRLRLDLPELVMLTQLEQGGQPGLQLDLLRAVPVDAQALIR